MPVLKKRALPPKEERELELLKYQDELVNAKIDYMSAMMGIDMGDDEEEIDEEHEDEDEEATEDE